MQNIQSYAALINNGDGTVTDDDIGIMWLLETPSDMNWADAQSWAGNLVFSGYDDWRLPSALDFSSGAADTDWNSTNNEFGHLYGTELGNPANIGDQGEISYSPLWWWTDTSDAINSDDAYAFFWSWDGLWLNESTANRTDMTTDSFLHVTAVREIGTANVPEPPALLLVLAGITGLISTRRKWKKI